MHVWYGTNEFNFEALKKGTQIQADAVRQLRAANPSGRRVAHVVRRQVLLRAMLRHRSLNLCQQIG